MPNDVANYVSFSPGQDYRLNGYYKINEKVQTIVIIKSFCVKLNNVFPTCLFIKAAPSLAALSIKERSCNYDVLFISYYFKTTSCLFHMKIKITSL